MGGCVLESKDKIIEMGKIIKGKITELFFKPKKKAPRYKDESENYESEVLLNAEAMELTAGIHI